MSVLGWYDNVKFLSSTTGTADFGIGSAVSGFRTPSGAGMPDGTSFTYSARAGTDWETGIGHYDSGTGTLVRDEVIESTNSNAKVDFASTPRVGLMLLSPNVVDGALMRRLGILDSASLSKLEQTYRFACGRFADGFYNSDGTNTGSSSNYLVDTGNKRLAPTQTSSTNQLPTMTGSTTSGVTITASSEYAGYNGWRAGDRILDLTNSWTTNGVQVATWEVDFGTPIILTSYSIKGDGSYLNRLPKDWTLQGWNGSTWVTLDTRTNETGWSATKRTYNFTNSTGYSKYRLNISAGNGGDGYLTIQEIELFNPATTNNISWLSTIVTHLASVRRAVSVFELVESDSITLNTDLKAYMSSDNGSNEDQGTLKLVGNSRAGKIIEARFNFTNPGTQTRVKLTSHNNKLFYIPRHGYESIG